MPLNRLWLGGWLAIASLPALAAERLVALTPDVADIVVALGAAKDVVGRNDASHQPELAHAAPIGLSRTLNAEPVARLKPTLVIGSPMAQPDSIYATLTRMAIPARKIGMREDGADYAQSIARIGELIGKPREAAALAQTWRQGMTPGVATGKRYLLSYDGRFVAGRNTAADTLIRAAGGINAAAELDGFKPLGKEGWAALRPDVIVLAEHNAAVFGGAAAFAKRPEIAASPAAKSGRIASWPAESFLRMGLASPQTVARLRSLAQ
ncbi:heme/hemin ABC transporter substrate-binding protein [Paludibacterium paludis]|uniref:Hemin-binding periplasmic protein HmuT n=1 Tax=Paludibacterium paludis TaxID=1225769 RepID=A0A918UBT1_9NEIS|nr:ABC transporter substrate-binding protein [Paludibacterium paludis]GGY25671.1 hemin-binding periplasmic protein HmuT [Paludibacterium paludis]